MEHVTMFGERLLELREKTGETQEQLANAIGITRQSLSRYEANDRTPNIDLIYNISKHYNISTDYLLGLSELTPIKNEMKIVCKYTGLSESAINNLMQIKEQTGSNEVLSLILENKKLYDLFDMIWQYGDAVINEKIMIEISNKLKIIFTTPDISDETKKKFLKLMEFCMGISIEKKDLENNGFDKIDELIIESCAEDVDFEEFLLTRAFIDFYNNYIVMLNENYSKLKGETISLMKQFWKNIGTKGENVTEDDLKLKELLENLLSEGDSNGEHNPSKE